MSSKTCPGGQACEALSGGSSQMTNLGGVLSSHARNLLRFGVRNWLMRGWRGAGLGLPAFEEGGEESDSGVTGACGGIFRFAPVRIGQKCQLSHETHPGICMSQKVLDVMYSRPGALTWVWAVGRSTSAVDWGDGAGVRLARAWERKVMECMERGDPDPWTELCGLDSWCGREFTRCNASTLSDSSLWVRTSLTCAACWKVSRAQRSV